MKIYPLKYILILCAIPFLSVAQQFNLKGNAAIVSANTFRLTEDNFFLSGMATNYYPVDLTTNFTIDFELNFGIRDADGADGIAFLLSRECNPTLTPGGGLGVSNTLNSIVVEFDTWNNGSGLDDDFWDHTGIYKDGNLSPAGRIYTLGATIPPCMSASCGDVEDGLWHTVQIEWIYHNATSQTIQMYFDGSLRVTATGNHITERFLGSNKVFWSLSAATGGARNLHQFRVSDDDTNNFIVSCGGTTTLEAPSVGSNYTWTNNLSTTYTATYTVYEDQVVTCNYTNFCGEPESVSFVLNIEEITPLFTLPSSICQGDTFSFPTISDNGISGTWSPALNTSISSTQTYTFTPNPNQCALQTQHTLTVKPMPVTNTISY